MDEKETINGVDMPPAQSMSERRRRIMQMKEHDRMLLEKTMAELDYYGWASLGESPEQFEARKKAVIFKVLGE